MRTNLDRNFEIINYYTSNDPILNADKDVIYHLEWFYVIDKVHRAMDHKTPPTYIIKNFQEPHENFAAHKVWGIGEGKSFSFSKYFLPLSHARIYRATCGNWIRLGVLRRQRGSISRITRGIIRTRLPCERTRDCRAALGKTRISFGFVV